MLGANCDLFVLVLGVAIGFGISGIVTLMILPKPKE